jgi:phosphotransferase family enzyme
MSRTGVEAKAPWRAVPAAVQRAVEEVAGARVTRGARIWGGYGPAPTFRLRLADGRGVFFKGIHGASNEFAQRALSSEERVYRELGALITPWAPRFYGAVAVDDWRALLLEDLGPKSAPPWTLALARDAARDFAAFHAHTLGCAMPGWLESFTDDAADITWERVEEETGGFGRLAELACDHASNAHAWLRAAQPQLARVASLVGAIPGPYALIHGDVRSDNLRVVNGHLRLFDWPFAQRGLPEFDLVEFAQSVTVDGGPEPERMVDWYRDRLAVRDDALDASVCWLAAFFAHFAWQPDIPELPRLRRFQRQQLAVTLRWAARRLALPTPAWTAALD